MFGCQVRKEKGGWGRDGGERGRGGEGENEVQGRRKVEM